MNTPSPVADVKTKPVRKTRAAIPGIRNQLHVYRNIVNPTIKDLLEKIDYDLQNISNKPVSNMEIVEWNLPIPYYNEKLEDLSYRYSRC